MIYKYKYKNNIMKLYTKLENFIKENNSDDNDLNITNKYTSDALDKVSLPHSVQGNIGENIGSYTTKFNTSDNIDSKYEYAKHIISSLNSNDDIDPEDEKLIDKMVDYIESVDRLKSMIIPPRNRK